MHTASHAAALSVSRAPVHASSTASRQCEMWLRNHHCDGPWTNNRLWEKLAAALAECSRHVHWSMASSPWCLWHRTLPCFHL